MSFVVTIDGPSAAGKSTTARAVAERLGFLYLDTGAFYRALALKALRGGVRAEDAEGLGSMARATAIDFSGVPSAAHVFLDGEDVSGQIRTPDVSEMSSRVAAVPEVRRQMVAWQRALRAKGPLVGEGRDLGTVVFPDADVKIYLDADLETRAKRRTRELHSRGIAVTLEAVRDDLARRDDRDRTRADSPLKPAEGARVVDTSGMELEEQVKAVLDLVTALPDCPGGPRKG
jgi:cytidylate kinase